MNSPVKAADCVLTQLGARGAVERCVRGWCAARAALASLALSGNEAAPEASPAAAAGVKQGAITLELNELSAATDGFSDEREIGRGGFGRVYRGDAAGSLRQAVAIKRASTGLELQDVAEEVSSPPPLSTMRTPREC